MPEGNHVLDGNLLRQTGASKEICAPKEFALEKLVDSLLSCKNHIKVSVALHEVRTSSNPGDKSILHITNYFLRLSLHTQNAPEVPSKKRFLCTC